MKCEHCEKSLPASDRRQVIMEIIESDDIGLWLHSHCYESLKSENPELYSLSKTSKGNIDG